MTTEQAQGMVQILTALTALIAAIGGLVAAFKAAKIHVIVNGERSRLIDDLHNKDKAISDLSTLANATAEAAATVAPIVRALSTPPVAPVTSPIASSATPDTPVAGV